MSQLEFIIVEGQNLERRSLGILDVEIVPRIGELVFYETGNNAGREFYKVKDIVHNLTPKCPTEIFMVPVEEDA